MISEKEKELVRDYVVNVCGLPERSFDIAKQGLNESGWEFMLDLAKEKKQISTNGIRSCLTYAND